MTSSASVAEDLIALGVERGATVMLHASMRRLGMGRAGAEALLDALDSVLGPEGTSLMVLGTDCAQDWVNLRPAAERPALLASAEPFDPISASVLPEVGYCAEAFRLRPGTLVNDNPSGRFGARGAGAQGLLGDAPWHDYYGPGSPLDRLCAAAGQILRVGAGPETVTALHYAEYLAHLPAKRRTRWHYRMDRGAGPEIVFIDCLDDANGIADFEGEDYFAAITKAYLATGRARTGRIGAADAELIDAADIVAFGADWMSRNLRS